VELKSMRTAPAARGRGIGARIVDHVLTDARARAIARISLETGSVEFFAAAHALYTKFGFAPCAPFGTYRNDPHSRFMTLAL
jgi:putative acetyltransferase